MELNIVHADITSELCQRCAACCRIYLTLANTDSRYRKFLRTIGYSVLPPAVEGEQDCCDEIHDVRLDMGSCKHLEITTGDEETSYRCQLHGTSEFPQLCADFDCVSWSKHNNAYNEDNHTIVTAQMALDALRNAGEEGPDNGDAATNEDAVP